MGESILGALMIVGGLAAVFVVVAAIGGILFWKPLASRGNHAEFGEFLWPLVLIVPGLLVASYGGPAGAVGILIAGWGAYWLWCVFSPK
jgi:uncharacterized PurR-regulated membrane protein YhhQ (DUF165 family)